MTDDYLDLIRKVQAGRMMHDSASKPSQISGAYWIEAKPRESMPAPTTTPAEFHILTDLARVDADWEKIKQATENGALGYKAKVATLSTDPQRPSLRLIVVKLADRQQSAELARVEAQLKTLGFAPRLVTE